MAPPMSDVTVLTPQATGQVLGGPRTVLRIEGAVLLLGAFALYAAGGQSWWLFAALFFVPDLAFLAYLAGPRLGAMAYNGAHSTIGPILLGCAGIAIDAALAQAIALIWLAHIGFDRTLGYGLKYASGFADTHLGTLGRRGGR